MVDHKVPHKGDQVLFWDHDNWQPVCFDCHDRHKQRVERRGYTTTVGRDGWPIDPSHPANRTGTPGGSNL